MECIDFKWTTADGIDIYGCEWPVKEARAVVGIIHGLGEHCHRYDPLADYFRSQGYGVVGYDQPGYGRSGGKRGHIAHYDRLLDGVGNLLLQCERRYNDLPVFLYGHSMGGNILLNYLIQRHPDISGAVVSAPHIRLAFRPRAASVIMARMARKILPGLTQSNGLATEFLSRDPNVEKAYKEDELVHDRISVSMALGLIDAANYLNRYSGAISIPLLLMHGKEDRITDPAGTAEFARRVTGPDISLHLWEKLYHELHNEPERQQVFSYVNAWLQPRMDPQKTQRPPKTV